MAMEFKRRLPIPMEIREEMPLSAELTAKKQAFDAEVGSAQRCGVRGGACPASALS